MLTDRKEEIVDFSSHNGCWYVGVNVGINRLISIALVDQIIV